MRQRTASSIWLMHNTSIFVASIFVPLRSGNFDCDMTKAWAENTIKVILA